MKKKTKEKKCQNFGVFIEHEYIFPNDKIVHSKQLPSNYLSKSVYKGNFLGDTPTESPHPYGALCYLHPKQQKPFATPHNFLERQFRHLPYLPFPRTRSQ